MLVILLFWIYYSAQIVTLWRRFTWLYASLWPGYPGRGAIPNIGSGGGRKTERVTVNVYRRRCLKTFGTGSRWILFMVVGGIQLPGISGSRVVNDKFHLLSGERVEIYAV